MTLVKTTMLNACAVMVRIASLLALNKILAVLVGPAGYALMGQLQNVVTMLTAVASAGVTTGVTKYTAEYGDDPQRQHRIWGTATRLGLFGALVLGIGVMALSPQLSVIILHSSAYTDVFVLVGACLLFFVLNAHLLSILNGKKEVGLFVVANIAGSFLALLITIALAKSYGLEGALIALAVNQSASFLFTLWLCHRTTWFSMGALLHAIDRTSMHRLFQFTLMALCTSAVGPIFQMLIRGHLLTDFGTSAAGNWEALTRISNLYLMFLTTPLSVYYLPKLAELTTKADIRAEMWRVLCFILPPALLMALTLYLLRNWMIPLLFSAEFLTLASLMPWQLIGDVLRVCAWLLSFFLLSKSMIRLFISSEIAFNIILLFVTTVLTSRYGVDGAPMAYAACYGIYVIVMSSIIFNILSDRSTVEL